MQEAVDQILDGRHLIGTLRSFDQYGNMVLESARERHYIEINLRTFLWDFVM